MNTMKCDTCKHSGQLPDDIFPKRLIKCCEKGHWCEGSSNPPGDPKQWENCPDYQDTTEYINMLYNLPFGISRQDARKRLGLKEYKPIDKIEFGAWQPMQFQDVSFTKEIIENMAINTTTAAALIKGGKTNCATCKHKFFLPGTMHMVECCEKGHWRGDFQNRKPDTSKWENCPDYQGTNPQETNVQPEIGPKGLYINLPESATNADPLLPIIDPKDLPEFLRKWKEEQNRPYSFEDIQISPFHPATIKAKFLTTGIKTDNQLDGWAKPEPIRSGKTWIEPSTELMGWWGKLEDPVAGMPGYNPEKDPFYPALQNAVNLEIELLAAQREIGRLKTFLHQHDLLSQFEIWQATEQEDQGCQNNDSETSK